MTSAPSTTRKRRSREETRQKLLDAALLVFARNGYERATVQEMFRQTVDASLSVAENERRILEQAFNMSAHPLGPAVILEFTAHGMRDKKVRDQLAKMYESWHTFVAETLCAGQELGIVRKDVDVGLLASTIMALFEGSMIQSHFAPANLRLDRKVEDLSALIAELISAS
jgi:hypothetical protein